MWISTDYEGAAKDLIQLYKYGHQRAAAQPLAEIMADTFRGFNSLAEISKKNYLLVAVPTASGRVRARSFDHSALLAYHIAANLGLELRKSLGRTGQSRQVGAKRQLRLAQLEGKFFVKNSASLKNRNIILIDDVITTGATITMAAKTLRTAGVKSVSALVFAKKL